MIPQVPDLQAARLLLLLCRASTQANFFLGTVAPEIHPRVCRKTRRAGLQVSQQSAPDRDAASTQRRGRHHALDIGRFGIGQRAEDTRRRALRELGRQFGDGQSAAPRSCQPVADPAERLKTVGARIPSWEALAGGVRPGKRRLKDREPNEPHFNKSQHPSQRRSGVVTGVTVGAGVSPIPKWSVGVRPFHNVPSGQSHANRLAVGVLLLRRFRLPLPLSSRFCSCGRSLNILSHHRAAGGKVGVLSRRGYAMESTVAQICC